MMKGSHMKSLSLSLVLGAATSSWICFGSSATTASQTTALDTQKIESITGLKGTMNVSEGVFKITQPRTDIPVVVDGFKMPPFMGLTSWAAFSAQKKIMTMGDIVLFQDEVNPVMSAALNGGLQVTALHNHFFYDEPKVYFMHIEGEGKLDELANGVKMIFEKISEIRKLHRHPAKTFGDGAAPIKNSIDAKPLEEILGESGQSKDGMFKVVFGLTTKMSCGCEAGKEMGVNTWAAFAGTNGNAIVDGDFAVHENQLQTVLKSLRASDINIVAIHHHMTGESPKILFLHYWGRGKAGDLARAVKTALEAQKKVKT